MKFEEERDVFLDYKSIDEYIEEIVILLVNSTLGILGEGGKRVL